MLLQIEHILRYIKMPSSFCPNFFLQRMMIYIRVSDIGGTSSGAKEVVCYKTVLRFGYEQIKLVKYLQPILLVRYKA